MNSLPIRKLSLGIAAAFTFAGLAAGATATTGTIGEIDIPGTPDNGVVCLGGYAPTFNGRNLTCSKVVTVKLVLACTDAKLTKYVARAAGSGGTPGGLDICIKDDPKVNIGSTDDISGLTKGVDYQFAKVDPIKVSEKVKAQHDAEVAALGLLGADVDAHGGATTTLTNDAGIIDKAQLPVTLFTRPVPDLGLISVGR